DGPPGWLAGFAPGSLVAASAAGGFLHLEPVDEGALQAPPPDVAGRLGALVELTNEGDGTPVHDDELQLLATLDGLGWFDRPGPPFAELAEAAGMEVDGDLIGRAGCWEQYKSVVDMVVALARHDGDEPELSLLVDALKAFDAWRADPDAVPPRPLAERLRARWSVSYWVLDELRRRGAGPDELAGFAAALGGPTGRWLTARAAALRGEAEAAEALARAALEADPGFGPSMSEAAWYASDRGRARDAVNLLQAVRDHGDPELRSLRRRAAAMAPSVGRNDRCPCGSGRKYKQCHLGRSALGEADRVGWLVDKVGQYMVETAPPDALDDAVAGADPEEPGAAALALDVVSFDGGWLERFIADRAVLLPDVERAWVERWAGEHVASLFRLAARHGDGRVELEDLATGSRYVVEGSTALGGLSVHRLAWARLVPVEDRWWTTGLARPAWLSERDALLAAFAPGTPVDQRLAALLSDPDTPSLETASGQPEVACTTVVAVGDATEAEKRLDEAFERCAGGGAWHATPDTSGSGEAVTAHYRLGDDGTLVVEAGSVARRTAALDELGSVLAAVEVVEETRVPAARAHALTADDVLVEVARRNLGPAGDDLDDDEDDYDEDSDDEDDEGGDDEEALEAALAEIGLRSEEHWVDQPVPALGGRTPRQAAADEAARPDLLTLLAELDDRPGPFDAARLRRRLGVGEDAGAR
ncbi:MAG TPA: SEC-C domain-containing protein, partial [Acidimicrobiales bacterium]|nr:SEC-C domain-containing protein [Acidimicrobiales bacterium]